MGIKDEIRVKDFLSFVQKDIVISEIKDWLFTLRRTNTVREFSELKEDFGYLYSVVKCLSMGVIIRLLEKRQKELEIRQRKIDKFTEELDK